MRLLRSSRQVVTAWSLYPLPPSPPDLKPTTPALTCFWAGHYAYSSITEANEWARTSLAAGIGSEKCGAGALQGSARAFVLYVHNCVEGPEGQVRLRDVCGLAQHPSRGQVALAAITVHRAPRRRSVIVQRLASCGPRELWELTTADGPALGTHLHHRCNALRAPCSSLIAKS